jgi:hypothetical protein
VVSINFTLLAESYGREMRVIARDKEDSLRSRAIRQLISHLISHGIPLITLLSEAMGREKYDVVA